jgi:hypothetical protein
MTGSEATSHIRGFRRLRKMKSHKQRNRSALLPYEEGCYYVTYARGPAWRYSVVSGTTT